ncbi:MAG: ribbon-helix-helix domain-containing protein [Tepidanaerobacteraceae bacterium]|jgi:metal-responsive CopG/Arc/MetJ family transcriptional regulator|nr:ribbon-helix-helix domain-containing protein [Tepidanaerobacteraceae bacterium]
MYVNRDDKKTKLISIRFPLALLKKIDALVENGCRSDFIISATENELKRINAKIALEKSFGTWSDENHPDLKDSDAIAKWVAENRTAYDYLRNTKGE